MVAILEAGDLYIEPDTTRAFHTVKGAMRAIPAWATRIASYPGVYYVDEINDRWLTIKTYRIEDWYY